MIIHSIPNLSLFVSFTVWAKTLICAQKHQSISLSALFFSSPNWLSRWWMASIDFIKPMTSSAGVDHEGSLTHGFFFVDYSRWNWFFVIVLPSLRAAQTLTLTLTAFTWAEVSWLWALSRFWSYSWCGVYMQSNLDIHIPVYIINNSIPQHPVWKSISNVFQFFSAQTALQIRLIHCISSNRYWITLNLSHFSEIGKQCLYEQTATTTKNILGWILK